MTADRNAVILVDHGSRSEAANANLEALAELLRGASPDRLVIAAHMELAPPTLAEAFSQCATRGVRRVTVMPYFLGPGRHTTRDIPAMVAEASEAHPGVEVHLANPLGVHPKLVEVILDRVAEAEPKGEA